VGNRRYEVLPEKEQKKSKPLVGGLIWKQKAKKKGRSGEKGGEGQMGRAPRTPILKNGCSKVKSKSSEGIAALRGGDEV